jgi:hypothetical protein
LNSAAVIAELETVDAKMVQRSIEPRYPTSDFIALRLHTLAGFTTL